MANDHRSTLPLFASGGGIVVQLSTLIPTIKDSNPTIFICHFRMTYSLRSMIGLMQKMFGDDFWENAILEATHWNYHPKNTQLRVSKLQNFLFFDAGVLGQMS